MSCHLQCSTYCHNQVGRERGRGERKGESRRVWLGDRALYMYLLHLSLQTKIPEDQSQNHYCPEDGQGIYMYSKCVALCTHDM